MNLRHLKCFLAVAEERHFTRTPSVCTSHNPRSRTIRDLEHDLGVALFERVAGTGTNLTPAGQALAESARGFSAWSIRRAVPLWQPLPVHSQQCASHCRTAFCPNVWRRCWPAAVRKEPDSTYSYSTCRWPNNSTAYSTTCLMSVLPALPANPTACPAKRCGRLNWSSLPLRHPLLVHKHVPLTELAACTLALFYPDLQSGLHQQVSSLLAGEAHHSPWRPRLAARRC